MTKETHEASRHIIKSFEARALKRRSLAVRFADDLTSLFGSIFFLAINVILIVIWIAINSGILPSIPIFDPFPYTMLTTILSIEAIVLTVIVLMSQNRQTLISSVREEMDVQVNLIAQREIRKILELQVKLLEASGVKLKDSELDEMLKKLDASYLERKLSEELAPRQMLITEKFTQPFMKATSDVKKSITEKH